MNSEIPSSSSISLLPPGRSNLKFQIKYQALINRIQKYAQETKDLSLQVVILLEKYQAEKLKTQKLELEVQNLKSELVVAESMNSTSRSQPWNAIAEQNLAKESSNQQSELEIVDLVNLTDAVEMSQNQVQDEFAWEILDQESATPYLEVSDTDANLNENQAVDQPQSEKTNNSATEENQGTKTCNLQKIQERALETIQNVVAETGADVEEPETENLSKKSSRKSRRKKKCKNQHPSSQHENPQDQLQAVQEKASLYFDYVSNLKMENEKLRCDIKNLRNQLEAVHDHLDDKRLELNQLNHLDTRQMVRNYEKKIMELQTLLTKERRMNFKRKVREVESIEPSVNNVNLHPSVSKKLKVAEEIEEGEITENQVNNAESRHDSSSVSLDACLE